MSDLSQNDQLVNMLVKYHDMKEQRELALQKKLQEYREKVQTSAGTVNWYGIALAPPQIDIPETESVEDLSLLLEAKFKEWETNSKDAKA